MSRRLLNSTNRYKLALLLLVFLFGVFLDTRLNSPKSILEWDFALQNPNDRGIELEMRFPECR